MVDHVTPAKRSEIMRAVQPKDTGPEMVVRRLAHAMGLRYRLHEKRLPGRPDLVFPRWRVALFVHGCFWHRHANCSKATIPKSNVAFWNEKFARNVERDHRAMKMLSASGWRCEIIWQCETGDAAALEARLQNIFGGRH